MTKCFIDSTAKHCRGQIVTISSTQEFMFLIEETINQKRIKGLKTTYILSDASGTIEGNSNENEKSNRNEKDALAIIKAIVEGSSFLSIKKSHRIFSSMGNNFPFFVRHFLHKLVKYF